MGSIAGWGFLRCFNRRRLLVVDGLDLGKTTRRRSYGTGRRKNDVYGGRLLRLATYDIEHLPGCPVRLCNRHGLNGPAGEKQYADASSVRSFSGHWRRRCPARWRKHRLLVCGTVSVKPEVCPLNFGRGYKREHHQLTLLKQSTKYKV